MLPNDQRGFSPFFSLIVGVIVLIVVIFLWFFFFKDSKLPSQKISNTPLKTEYDHPELFIANLEYNPKTNSVNQLGIGQTKGDIPILLPQKPTVPDDYFLYQIKIITPKNLLLLEGWQALKKESILKGDIYRFQVSAEYFKDSLIMVYLPNGKLIWTGKMI